MIFKQIRNLKRESLGLNAEPLKINLKQALQSSEESSDQDINCSQHTRKQSMFNNPTSPILNTDSGEKDTTRNSSKSPKKKIKIKRKKSKNTK